MRQATEYSSYIGTRAVLSHHAPTPVMRVSSHRHGFTPRGPFHNPRGFTLIEVTVAMGIFLMVTLALVMSYYGYGTRTQALRVATVGQNLAQLEMESLRSMDDSVLASLAKGNPIGDVNYINPSADAAINGFPERQDTNPSSTVYDSGEIIGTYYIADVKSINGSTPASVSSVSALGLVLPPGVVTVSVDSTTSPADYTVVLHKEVFPGYTKRVVVTDISSLHDGSLFRIEVTVFWKIGGQPKQSYTVSSER